MLSFGKGMKRLSLACGSGVKLFTLGTSVNLKFWLWFIQLLYIANVSALFPYLERSQNSTFKCLDLSRLQKADEECYQSARALFTGNRLNMGVPERWSTIWSCWCCLCPQLLCDFTGLHASYAALSFFKHAFNDTLLLSAAGKETFNNLRLKHAALKRKQLCFHWRVSGRQKKTQRKRGGRKKQEAEHEWAEGKRGLTDRRGAWAPKTHLHMPRFPLCGSVPWHTDTNSSAPGGCHIIWLLYWDRPLRRLKDWLSLSFGFVYLLCSTVTQRNCLVAKHTGLGRPNWGYWVFF